jgi:ABC-type transport system involved in cytochrome c biogenesis permease subunit
MVWENFDIISLFIMLLESIAIVLFYRSKKRNVWAHLLYLLGASLMAYFIINLWLTLERPPLRTLGETRLWYAFFLPVIGYVTYVRWNYKWILIYSTALSGVFMSINILNPDIINKTLMPALQSVWFVPHVIVYMFAYAMLGASSVVAMRGLWSYFKNKKDPQLIIVADNLVFIGFGFLTLGLLFGAMWAKTAWGHYWTWDPKETWAFLTWLAHLVYIHFRFLHPKKHKMSFQVLTFAFVVLLSCWFGVNYMPSAKMSVHTYTED